MLFNSGGEMKYIIVLIGLFFLSGCATVGSTAKPVNYNPQGNSNVSLIKPLLGDGTGALN